MLSSYNRHKKRPVSQKKPSTQQRDSTNHETGRTQPRAPMGNQTLIAELQNTLEEETSSSNQQEESLTSKILKSGRKPTNKISQARPTIKHEHLKARRERPLVDGSSSTTEKKYPKDVTVQQNRAAKMAQHAQLNDRNHSNFIPLAELHSPKYEHLKARRERLLVDDSSSTTEEKYPEDVTFKQNQAAKMAQHAQFNNSNQTYFNHLQLPNEFPEDVTFHQNQAAKMAQHAQFNNSNQTISITCSYLMNSRRMLPLSKIRQLRWHSMLSSMTETIPISFRHLRSTPLSMSA